MNPQTPAFENKNVIVVSHIDYYQTRFNSLTNNGCLVCHCQIAKQVDC